MANNLTAGKQNRQDEFYTKLSDIEQEMNHYTSFFKNKVIYCNCDNYNHSNFFNFFYNNFKKLELKKLIVSCYQEDKQGFFLEYSKEDNSPSMGDFKGNGDFRNKESLDLLMEADIVITNPPFSLFRDFINLMFLKDKKFIILGSQNNLDYKGFFDLFKEKKLFFGYYIGNMEFAVPSSYEEKATGFRIDKNNQKWRSLGNICWFTNLEINKKIPKVELTKTYYGNEIDYPKYDNFNAINTNRIKDIPKDYEGLIGAPITLLPRLNFDQFELLGIDRFIKGNKMPKRRFSIRGKIKYARIVIKNKLIIK